MKLYTRRGDAGQTDLFDGGRVGKTHPRIAACGDVDELNSALGLALSGSAGAGSVPDFVQPLISIQSRLFEIGADLATPRPEGEPVSKKVGSVPRIEQRHIDELEGWIDAATEATPAMRHFVLPAGCELAARLHLARTICRRAERSCVELADREAIGSAILTYLNRLSDLLFAMARQANREAGIEDVPWIAPEFEG
jgi:cob(I)alamin adenosyltransferase